MTRLEGLIHEANGNARDGARDGARRSVGPLERGGLGWVAGVLRQIPVPVGDIFRAYTKVIEKAASELEKEPLKLQLLKSLVRYTVKHCVKCCMKHCEILFETLCDTTNTVYYKLHCGS